MSHKGVHGVSIAEDLTRKIADLSRLELSSSEVATFTVQLGQILSYVQKLQELSVDGIEPIMSPFELETAYREDQVVASRVDQDGKPKVLQSAPDLLDDGYKVPPIL